MKNKTRKVYANLGCGTNVCKSTQEIKWLNVDKFIGTKDEDFLEGDLLDLPIEKSSVDYVLCDNVLEHIDMKDIPTVLHEIRRILKPGGKVVILVPDFKDAAEQWLRYDHNTSYNPFVYNWLSEVIYGNQIHPGEYHRTPMTPPFLHYMLNMVGLPKHEIVTHPQNAPIPMNPGMPAYPPNTLLRNAQIVCTVYK